MTRRIYFLLVALLSCISMSAQKFVLDPLFEDSVECIVAAKPDSVWKSADPFTQIKFAKGMEFESCGPAEGYYIAFEHGGKHYMAYKKHLKFSDDNPDGIENPLPKDVISQHGALGHLYATSVPVMLVLVLIGLVVVSFLLTMWKAKLSKYAVIVIPTALLCVSLIEVVGNQTLGSDLYWWCDSDRYGFFGSLLRVIPFGLVVALQYFSFKMYEKIMFIDAPEGTEKKLSLKPAAISLAICIPVLLVYFFVVQQIIGWKGVVSNIIMDILFIGTMVAGILISLKQNIETMGKVKGIAVTAFTVVYLLGLIIAAWGVIIVFFQLIFQMLMVAAAIVIFAVLSKRNYYKGSDGHTYADSGFESMHRVD